MKPCIKKLFSKDKYLFIKLLPSVLVEFIPLIIELISLIKICSLNLVLSVTNLASYRERTILEILNDHEQNGFQDRFNN